MELESTTCCGCLSTNRKVETINDFMIKKCYSNIINEIPALIHNGFPISLCWLCAALLKKFTRFKHQVLQSYQALQECSKMNFCNEYHTKLTHQKLQIQKVINISISPEDMLVDKEFSVDLVKTESIEPEETNEDISIKEEIDSFDDDDDMALIEMADKKKKNTKSSSKKRRKLKQKAEAEMFTEIELTGAQLEAERRLSRDKEEYVNAMFRCDKCILPFPNADDFKDHMNLKHEVIGKKSKKPYYKYCTVPKCKNNNRSTPDKVFFHVPKDVKLRQQWCKLMRRTKVSTQSSLHCCEDHFDVKEDTSNYMEYNIKKREGIECNLRLKKGVLPHKFLCQKQKTSSPVVRMAAVKRQRMALVNDALAEYTIKGSVLETGEQQSDYEASHTHSTDQMCDITQAGPSTWIEICYDHQAEPSVIELSKVKVECGQQ